MSVAFLEDLVSEIGIWSSFTEKNMELYGKKLPFFDDKEYYDNEVNYIDIQFIVWYVLNVEQNGNYVHYDNTFIKSIGSIVYKFIDDAYE